MMSVGTSNRLKVVLASRVGERVTVERLHGALDDQAPTDAIAARCR
jgi:hypothetical protein